MTSLLFSNWKTPQAFNPHLETNLYSMLSLLSGQSILNLHLSFVKFHQMDANELNEYMSNLIQRLLTRYNSYNYHSFLSLPYINQDISFRSHWKGNSDPTKSALQARFYQLKPFLNFDPNNVTSTIRQAYLDTWCRHSILGTFQQNKVIFHPLQTTRPTHPSWRLALWGGAPLG